MAQQGDLDLVQYAIGIAETSSKNVLNSGTMIDSVGKLRVSNPQNLIDTDFEYGLQNTKWETLQLVNNVPTFYSRDADGSIDLSNVETVQGSSQITVTTSTAHGLLVGSPFYITGLNEVTAEGYNIVLFVISATKFIYRANSQQPYTGSIFDSYTSQLYNARVYQGTQFNAENIVSMETDGADASKITVATLNPHGFQPQTSVILINSVGQKELPFDAAADVDIENTLEVSNTITKTAAAGASNEVGYDYLSVNPYDWQSRKCAFFASSNVDVAANTITIPDHGFTSNDTLMYVAPVGDTAVGGLKNYAPYGVTAVDANTIQLRGIYSDYHVGLSLYRIVGRINTPISFMTSAHDYNAYIDSTANNFLAVATSRTSLAVGYFIPPVTGNYQFRVFAGNESRMTFWWGQPGTFNRTSSHTALWTPSTTDATHGYEITAYNGTATSGNIFMTAGLWYPIRIQCHGRGGSGGSNSNSFSYTDPLQTTFGSTAAFFAFGARSPVLAITAINTTSKVLTTATHNFKNASAVQFTSTSNSITGLTSGTTYYVRTLTATTFTLHPTATDATNNTNILQIGGTNTANTNFVTIGHTFYTVPTNRYTKEATAMDISAQGTNLYGLHSLHKCYLANIRSGNFLTVEMNAANYTNAPLILNNAFSAFTPYVPNPSTDPTHPFIPYTFAFHSATHILSTDNISRANYVTAYTRNAPVIGTQVTITSFTSTALGSTGLTTANLTTTFTTGHAVLFTTTSNSFTSLTNNTVYYIRRTAASTVTLHATVDAAFNNTGIISITGSNTANTNFLTSLSTNIELTASTNGSTIAINTNQWNGTLFVVPTISLDTRDSIYAPNHGLLSGYTVSYTALSGTGIVGLTDGSSYKILKLSDNRVRLLTLSNEEVDLKTVGDGDIRLLYQAPNPTRDMFYIPEHGLFNTSTIVYNNNGNTTLPGLTDGGTYYVWDATTDRFRLSANQASFQTVDLTGISSGTHLFTSINRATDGIATIENVPANNSMELTYPFKIPPKTIAFDPVLTVHLEANAFYFANHQQRTGNRVVYSDNGNATIDGLTSDTSYYVIRQDLDYFKLATSYANALDNTAVDVTSLGTGTDHQMTFYSVLGEVATSSNVTITTGASNIYAPNEDLLSTMRIGDAVSIVLTASPTERIVSAINTTSGVITTSVVHGYTTGTGVKYSSTSTSISTLTNGSIFYVNVLSTTTFTLHLSPADATNAANVVALAGTVTASAHKFLTNFIGSSYDSTIAELNDANNAILNDASPSTRANGVFVRATNMYPRASGAVLHRPYDGGAELIPAKNPDSQIIRQTRKYFRYQSGKSIQMSSAVNFSGYTEIDSLYRVNSTAYVVTKRPHRMSLDVSFTIENASLLSEGTWNGSYIVSSIIDERIFAFEMTGSPLPTETTAGGFPAFYVNTWTDASIRVGLFDEQNGMFFQYDGSTLYCVRRNSITQLPGSVIVAFNSSRVEGVNTKFTSQLEVGTRIVMKGISYKVVNIASDLVLYIQPPYRGIDNTNVIVSKTIDERVPQSQWNLDKVDGTTPSGHVLDIHKIQMCFIDYSWYGAGNIRFGFRTVNGAITYCHQFVHSNHQVESYMRSGNMAGRYEVVTNSVPTYVPSLLHWGTSIIMDGRFDDDKAYWFTTKGQSLSYTGLDRVVFTAYTAPFVTTTFEKGWVANQTVTGYSGKYWRITSDQTASFTAITYIPNGTTLEGVGLAAGTKTVGTPIRGRIGGGAVMFIYIDKQPTGSNTAAQTITAGNDDPIPYFIPITSIRLSPSVDNSRTGPVGSREIINRMQLVLRKIGILTSHELMVSMLLNTVPYRANWTPFNSPSLCQVILHEKGDTVAGGTEIYNFRATGGEVDVTTGRRSTAITTEMLEELVDLGNSILGGDGTFPNGPDVLTIGVSILDASGISVSAPFTVTGRLTWTESQA